MKTTNKKEVKTQCLLSTENMVADKELLDGAMLCKRLSITRPTLIKLRMNKQIPYFRVGGLFRYNYDEVLKSLEIREESSNV